MSNEVFIFVIEEYGFNGLNTLKKAQDTMSYVCTADIGLCKCIYGTTFRSILHSLGFAIVIMFHNISYCYYYLFLAKSLHIQKTIVFAMMKELKKKIFIYGLSGI